MRPLLLFAASLTLSGCMLEQEDSRDETFRFNVAGVPRIEVDSDDGPIDLRGTSSEEVVVKVYRRAKGPSRRQAAERLDDLEVTQRQEGRTIKIQVRRRDGRRVDWGRVWAEIEIRAPRRTDARLETRDGRIEVADVEGELSLASGDGPLRVRDTKGNLKLRAEDGSVQGDGLSGTLDASTGDGRIRLDGSFTGLRAVTSDGSIQIHCEENLRLESDWLIRSSDGSIELTLPRDVSAEIDASTGDGRIRSDLSLADKRSSHSHLRGSLGDGGKLVLVKTSDGEIRLRAH